ncbi:hypothetical protein B7O87_09415 [Cylindrospermopsis raciborskii CENA303]|uniref:Uncharacterized protein n=1 Tax=Cylindrospermopsis raciborskii CENA303 TaxID=1170769 RepID=A0A1X4G6H9_9CYAN|nr:hypothetical protein [Cylindrospermopsis raciborskii]OSO90567.1 hypothetical protein B7O87_09415 [Cylindrospermopsis raciborskii CENA303]
MSIIALRAWYIQDYEPITELEKRPPDIRLSKKSLLKSGLRADFLEDADQVRTATWFKQYLEGDSIEFYIEGSGGYSVANVDLISHEIYLTKQSLLSQLEPTIFFSFQTEYARSSDLFRENLQETIKTLNSRSRVPLTLIESSRSRNKPLRLNRTIMRKIRKSLLFIADTTPITSIEGKDFSELIPSPNVCIEIGYALEHKRTEQIIFVHVHRPELEGQFPFDLSAEHIAEFSDADEIKQFLTVAIESKLSRFRLFG